MTTKPTDTPALAACAFCGGKAGKPTYEDDITASWFINCRSCHAQQNGNTMIEAIEAWNTRTALREAPPPPAPSAEAVRETVLKSCAISSGPSGPGRGLPYATLEFHNDTDREAFVQAYFAAKRALPPPLVGQELAVVEKMIADRKRQLASCERMIELLQPEWDKFEAKTGHDTYVARDYADHTSAARKHRKEIAALEVLAALPPSAIPDQPGRGALCSRAGHNRGTWTLRGSS